MRNELTIGESEAQVGIDAVRARLEEEGQAAVVAVADAHGDLIALVRADGAKCAPIQIAINKAYTAVRERCPSVSIGQEARHPQRGFDISYYADPRIVGWGGGVPILHEGQVVGAVGVSGLPEEEDMRLAAIGVAAIAKVLRAP
jgi:glc operon protein GlcG